MNTSFGFLLTVIDAFSYLCIFHSQYGVFRDSSVSTSVHKMGTSASRILPPWDLLRRGCVFKDRGVLLVEDEMCDLTYAPNCATFSRAREIPTRGVKSCPRAAQERGIPSEPEGMSREDSSA